MIVVLPKSLLSKYSSLISSHFPKAVLLKTALQTAQGLGKKIGGAGDGVLIKNSLTSTGGAGRVVFLFLKKKEEITFLLLALKKDKKIGENITLKNATVKKEIEKNLDLVAQDAEQDNLEIIFFD